MSRTLTVQTSDPKYLKAAFSVLGLSEIAGARHEKKILEMYAASGHPEIHDDETPWCAAFIGWCLREGGIIGTKSLMARSYATFGKAVNKKGTIPRGAIAVWTRDGGNHVNFVLDDDGTRVTCIGGNQSNQRGGGVTISTRRKSEAVAFRMPNVPAKRTPPLMDHELPPQPTEPERILPEDGSQPAPKSMATSKIGNAQIAAGAVTTVAAGAQVAKPFMETTTETVAAVSEMATQTGTIVETTKVVTTAVPSGFWMKTVEALASPAFIACAVLTVIAVAGFTWYWRRQHRQAGV